MGQKENPVTVAVTGDLFVAEINFFENARSCLTITSQSTRKAYGHFSFGEHIRLSKPDRTLGRNSELVIGETIGDPPGEQEKACNHCGNRLFHGGPEEIRIAYRRFYLEFLSIILLIVTAKSCRYSNFPVIYKSERNQV